MYNIMLGLINTIFMHISSIYESDAEFSSVTVNLNKLFSKMNSTYLQAKLLYFSTNTYTAAVYIISELGTRVLARRGGVKHKYKLTF